MKEFIKIPYGTKKIFLDFDGVLVDSNKFKEIAIEKSIKFYENDLNIVNTSLEFFNANAGIGRKVKLKKFFNEEKVDLIMKKYANYCKEYLLRASLTQGSENFIKQIKKKYPEISLYILSGAEKDEVFDFLKRKNFQNKFTDLLCSEKSKFQHLKNFNLDRKDLFIGDSKNDLKVSKLFSLNFILVSDFASACSAPEEEELNDIMGVVKNLSFLII